MNKPKTLEEGARPEDNKYLTKSHWRHKLFMKDEAKSAMMKEKANEDIMDFLRPSTVAPSPPREKKTSNAPVVTRIDTTNSRRWPSAAEVNQLSANSAHVQSLSRARSVSPKRKKKGLVVRFTDSQPDIIGEGGDEAEDPPKDILRLRARSLSPSMIQADLLAANNVQVSAGHELERKPLPEKSGNRAFGQSAAIRRMATGYGHARNASDRSMPLLNTHEFKPLPPISSAARDPPIINAQRDQSPGPETPRTYASQAKMRAEEGMAFQRRNRDPFADDLDDAEEHMLRPAQLPPITPLPSMYAAEGGMPVPPRPMPTVTPKLHPLSPMMPFNKEAQPLAIRESLGPNLSKPPTPPEIPPHTPQIPPFRHPEPFQAQAKAQAPKPPPRAGSFSLPTLVSAIASDALDGFSARVHHLSRLFYLAAQGVKAISEPTFEEWNRAALWWFLRGRMELENAIRNRSSHPDAQSPKSLPHQAFADLAKALWIANEIAPQHPELSIYGNAPMAEMSGIARRRGHEAMAEVLEANQTLIANLRALAMSMKRNNFLPPAQEILPQGLDTSIWVRYPSFKPDICVLLAGNASKSMVLDSDKPVLGLQDSLPLGDTQRDYNYGRMFVEVSLSSGDDGDDQPLRLPCVLSILREKTDWQMKITLASQSGLVHVSVQSNKKLGPTWDDVRWRAQQYYFKINLPRGFIMDVYCKEKDFKTLWNIYDYTQMVEAGLQPKPGEELLFENHVRVFQYTNPDNHTKKFPMEPLKRCRMRLFEKKISHSEGVGNIPRSLHRGFRLQVVTSPKTKTLSSVGHDIGQQDVIQFGLLRGDSGDPALQLRIREHGKLYSMVFTFHQDDERAEFNSLLNGTTMQAEESLYANLPLKNLFMVALHDYPRPPPPPLQSIEWQRIRVINKDPENPDADYAETVLSPNLRICVDANIGIVTDRVNLGPGELQIRLDADMSAKIAILRPEQNDLTMCVAEDQTRKDTLELLSELSKAIQMNHTVRSYYFHQLQDLHVFQAALTGFTVKFDGVASSFAISRRRMVVPIYKRWEANQTRIQIIQQEKVVQLAAFFTDFSHGDCMNFQLKGTDVFEYFSKSGKYFLRIVDAKFSLPKAEGVLGKQFVCLDLPEYPGEHDDIMIAFDNESGMHN
ncbi:MAG: hypothetical protein M1829_001037 [Trizodia sp. TS-e1964]|nr:MAG: hypothetical protein M1829_001037 [Trizodia sp. TS-e1964]